MFVDMSRPHAAFPDSITKVPHEIVDKTIRIQRTGTVKLGRLGNCRKEISPGISIRFGIHPDFPGHLVIWGVALQLGREHMQTRCAGNPIENDFFGTVGTQVGNRYRIEKNLNFIRGLDIKIHNPAFPNHPFVPDIDTNGSLLAFGWRHIYIKYGFLQFIGSQC